jgi:hypothetical protein
MTLKTRIYSASATAAIAAVAGMAALASMAAAAQAPAITATAQNGSNVVISSALVGTQLHASVTVASSSATTTAPSGTVDFNLYAGTSCSGAPAAQTGVAIDPVTGYAQSATTTLPIGGLSYRVYYSGDNSYASGYSGCVGVSAMQSVPAISLSLSNTAVQAGSSVYAIPSLTNETGDAGGSLQYDVYSNNTCTTLALNAGSKAVANGATPNSDSWQFITPGTYYWQAVYSGDANNAAATSSCNAAGTILTVTAVQSATPTISTQLSNSSVVAGSSVYDTATLANASSGAGGTVAYKAYTDNACTAGMMDAGTKTVTNAVVPSSNSIVFNTPGTYYWQAVYSGDANNAAATSSCASEVLTVTSTTPPSGSPGTISGTVFNDLNKNDKQDSGEAGLAGWHVWLHKAATASNAKNAKHDFYDDPIIATATTDGSGNYSFGSLPAGTYFLEEEEQSGWNQTSSDTKVVLTTDKTSADVDFSNVQKNNNGSGNGNNNGGNNGHNDNGNHKGWFNFNANFFNWFHLGNR